MKKLYSSVVARNITLLVLFFVASLFVAYGWFLFVPIVTHYGRMLLTYFPTLFAFGVPIFSFFMLWMYWHSVNVANRYRIVKIYSITLVVLMGICIPFHVLAIGLSFGWNGIYGTITPLFPYDLLTLMIIFLAIGIYLLMWVFRNEELKKVPITVKNQLRRRAFVAMAFVSAFTAHFLGLFFQAFFIIDSFDPNWYGMIPAILLNLVPFMSLLMFVYYRHQKDEKAKRKIFGLSLISLLSATFALLLWELIAVLINPYLFTQSLSNFYLLGYAIKIPLGYFLIIIMLFVEYLVIIIRYCKLRRMVKHEK